MCFLICGCEYENADMIIHNNSWSNDISRIIEANCSYAGCHSSGAVIGDYNIYSELKEKIDNGTFQLVVFDLRIMPPLYKGRLSDADLLSLRNWVADGAKE